MKMPNSFISSASAYEREVDVVLSDMAKSSGFPEAKIFKAREVSNMRSSLFNIKAAVEAQAEHARISSDLIRCGFQERRIVNDREPTIVKALKHGMDVDSAIAFEQERRKDREAYEAKIKEAKDKEDSISEKIKTAAKAVILTVALASIAKAGHLLMVYIESM